MPVAESPLTPAYAFDPLYTTSVRVTGAAGEACSDDGDLQVGLSSPEALGVVGAGTNPGQLFAASYASCFHGILLALGEQAGADLRDAVVRVTTTYLQDPKDGSHLMAADIDVDLPHVSQELGLALVRDTERACPYAKMARQGVSHVVADSQMATL